MGWLSCGPQNDSIIYFVVPIANERSVSTTSSMRRSYSAKYDHSNFLPVRVCSPCYPMAVDVLRGAFCYVQNQGIIRKSLSKTTADLLVEIYYGSKQIFEKYPAQYQ